MTAIDDLAQRHSAAPAPDALPAPPGLHVAVLTCMDARIDVFTVLGLHPGDAHVIRNAGGVVTDDAIRSLALSQRELGTREVMVIQHTTCGVSTVTEDGFKNAVEADCGVRPPWAVEAFTDLDANIRDSVRKVRESPFLPHTDAVRGFRYDIADGSLTEIS